MQPKLRRQTYVLQLKIQAHPPKYISGGKVLRFANIVSLSGPLGPAPPGYTHVCRKGSCDGPKNTACHFNHMSKSNQSHFPTTINTSIYENPPRSAKGSRDAATGTCDFSVKLDRPDAVAGAANGLCAPAVGVAVTGIAPAPT